MVAAVVVTGATSLMGCSAAAPPKPVVTGAAVDYQAPSALRLSPQKLARVVQDLPVSSPQRPLLQDGRVSAAELALSWTRLRSCVETGGLVVKGPFINPITNTEYLYTYARPKGATASAGTPADDQFVRGCEEKFWLPLSSVYSANTPQRMDSRLVAFMTDCMTKAHFPTSGATTFDQLVRDGAGRVQAPRVRQANDCLDQGVPKLFPELPYFPRP